MALVAKPVSVAAPQSVTAIRSANLARTGAPGNPGGTIDAVTNTSGALIEDGTFSAVVGQSNREFSEQSSFAFRQSREDQLPNPRTGIINVTSQGFVELLKLRDLFAIGSGAGHTTEQGVNAGRLIGHAVALYEESIEIAAGTLNLRGATVSITL